MEKGIFDKIKFEGTLKTSKITGKLLKYNRTPLTNKIYANAIGKKIVHPISINWSYLYRGKVARTKMKKKQTIIILKLKKIAGEINLAKRSIGALQPPKNSKTKIADINNILLYSAKKNSANIIELYSTL